MKIHFTSSSRPKRIAKELRKQLAEIGFTISLPASQDLTAQMHGYAHWHELSANIGVEGPVGADTVPNRMRQEEILVARFPALSGRTDSILDAIAFPEGGLVLGSVDQQAKISSCERDGFVIIGISLRKPQAGFPDGRSVMMTIGIIANGPSQYLQPFYSMETADTGARLEMMFSATDAYKYHDIGGVLSRLGYPGNAKIPCARDIGAKDDAEAWEKLRKARASMEFIVSRDTLLSFVRPPEPPRLRDLDFDELYVSEQGEAMIKFGGSQADEVPALFIREMADFHAQVRGRDSLDFRIKHDGFVYNCSKITSGNGTWVAARRRREACLSPGVEIAMRRAEFEARSMTFRTGRTHL
ncbi:hypothetical protein ACVIGB_001020 [Bradyrhizobium sp. USDA 4341]